MLLQLQINTSDGKLDLYCGPSMSSMKVGTQCGNVLAYDIINDSDYIWYRTDPVNNSWVCGQDPSGVIYASVLTDLDPSSPSPQPSVAPYSSMIDDLLKSIGQLNDYNNGTLSTNEANSIAELTKAFNDYQDSFITGGVDNSTPFDASNYIPLDDNLYDPGDFEQGDDNVNESGFPAKVGTNSDGVNIYDYTIDTSFIHDAFNSVKQNLNLLSDKDNGYKTINLNLFSKFNRFKVPFPDYHLTKSFSYVFFTRPDLNLVENKGGGNFGLNDQASKDPVYYYLYKNNPQLILSLTHDFSSDHDFHPFLSNCAQSFELSDEYIKTIEHGETFTGYKIQYGRNNIESRTAGTFSVSFIDDQEFSVYKTHKAWIDYISKVYRGELVTKNDYLRRRILDYATSVYYIICAADGETVLFWSKYYGVFPTQAPSSTQSWSRGNMVKMPEYNITYAYAVKEDFNPITLAEFNMNSGGNYEYRKTYEPALLSTGLTMTGAPFIETTKQNGTSSYIFKLRFRNK